MLTPTPVFSFEGSFKTLEEAMSLLRSRITSLSYEGRGSYPCLLGHVVGATGHMGRAYHGELTALVFGALMRETIACSNVVGKDTQGNLFITGVAGGAPDLRRDHDKVKITSWGHELLLTIVETSHDGFPRAFEFTVLTPTEASTYLEKHTQEKALHRETLRALKAKEHVVFSA